MLWKKMWMMINKLKGNEEIENSESEVYNSDSVPLKQEKTVDLMEGVHYTGRKFTRSGTNNNDMKMVWT